MQKITLIGNLGRDAEIKAIKDKTFAVFSIADSEDKDTTTWYSVLKRVNADNKAVQFWKKGATLFVEGRLSVKTYEGQKGIGIDLTVFADDVQIIRFAPKEEGEQAPASGPAPASAPAQAAAPASTADDDDLPF